MAHALSGRSVVVDEEVAEVAENPRETEERPRAARRGRWFSAALVLLSLFGIASLFTGPGGFVRIRNLRSELALVNDHNFDLVQSAHRLQSQLDRLQTDEGEVERLARRHRLVRDGETLYQLGRDVRRRERAPAAGAGPSAGPIVDRR